MNCQYFRVFSSCTVGVAIVALCGTTVAAQAPAPEVPPRVQELQVAAMNGDLPAIAEAVQAHVSIDMPGESRMTALGIAALYGRADAIRALVAAGASVKADQDGETALAVAAHEGHTAAVDALLAAGADVNEQDKYGNSALMIAASSNRASVIRVLLEKGAAINATNSDGATALVASAYGGHAEATSSLLAGGAHTDVKDRAGRTAIMASALGGNAAVTKLLLENRADPTVQDNNQMNALVYAASTGQDEVVAVLQKAGVTAGSDLALAFAVRGCRVPLTQSLVAGGASLDADLNGDHLLLLATGSNCVPAVEYLLGRGVNINRQSDQGMTALMRAAGEGFADLVSLLLSKGADMELQTPSNQSAWLFAAMGNHPDIVEMLRANREARAKQAASPANGSRTAPKPPAAPAPR